MVRRMLAGLPYLAAGVSLWPLLVDGFPRGHDWSFELVRVAEYQAALAAGQWPPFWGENLYGGYGSPIFLFYAPLFLFVSAIGSFVLTVPTAVMATVILLTGISVWTIQRMLFAARGAAGPVDAAAARVAAYLFVLSPYLIGDKLIRNAHAEFAALCLAPLALAALFALRRPSHRAGALLAAALALVILTHNLTALIVAGLLGIGAPILYVGRGSRRTWLALGTGIALGLTLAAFFWVPAFALGSWMRPEHLLTGKFDFHVQFPGLVQLFGYERFFSLGLLPLLVWAGGVAVALRLRGRGRAWNRVLVAGLLAAAGFVFLSLRASTPVWESVPWLPLFQFPWRMVGPLALMTALLGGLVFAHLIAASSPRRRLIFEIGLLAVCIVNALPRLADYRPLPEEIRTQLSARLAPDGVRSSGQTATVGDEYLPAGADPGTWRRQRPAEGPVVGLEPGVRVRVRRDRGRWIELDVEAAAPARLRLARWQFPGWQLEINGARTPIKRNPFGSLEVSVPAGASQVSVRLRAPRVRRVWLLVSGLGLLLVSALGLGRPAALARALGP